ncbi:uracil-DNA glycosylase [bacterium]|nr:MAG: uracil-DNA glycosylase [bacterium]
MKPEPSAGRPDDYDAVLRDFVTWLNQNDGDGAWYLDQVEELPATVDTEVAPTTAPVSEPESAPLPVATPAPRQLPPLELDADFKRICEVFVAETMGAIARHPEAKDGPPQDPYLAEAGGDRTAALARLREEVLPCTSCNLSAGRNNTVFGAGSPEADIMFIGEAPGRDEDLQGEPFVGRSGQLLTKIIGAIGLARDDVYIANILKCRPPENRDPAGGEVTACEPHLKRQLAIIRPRVICCLGRIAAQTLLNTNLSLKRLRESVHFYAGIPVMATYHPAALLRNPQWKNETWNDVRKLRVLRDALVQER